MIEWRITRQREKRLEKGEQGYKNENIKANTERRIKRDRKKNKEKRESSKA